MVEFLVMTGISPGYDHIFIRLDELPFLSFRYWVEVY